LDAGLAADGRTAREVDMVDHGYIASLRGEIEVPRNGILSRTVHDDERLTLTLFGFDTGHELTEHTSSRAAVIEVIDGTADITLDGETIAAGPGAWISMPPGMRHAIVATTPLVMALTLLK
jgi:quercetin dioxygenase-like cupin family protein